MIVKQNEHLDGTLFSAYPEVMNIAQVAKALNICQNHVRKMIYEHELPAKKVGYRWRILRADVRAMMLGE